MAYSNWAATYDDLGQPSRAIQDYDEAIRLNPQDASSYAGRGNLYQGIGQYERAVQDHDEAIRLDPEHSLAYVNRALSYTFPVKDEEARKDVERAEELGIGSRMAAAVEASIEEAKRNR